jgi:hypothetical protein
MRVLPRLTQRHEAGLSPVEPNHLHVDRCACLDPVA